MNPEMDWESDFYEVLPVIKSSLTLDSKVARIKTIVEKLITAAENRGRKEAIGEAKEMIKKNIWNPAISVRDSRIPEDPERAADEAISYMHEKVNDILDQLK